MASSHTGDETREFLENPNPSQMDRNEFVNRYMPRVVRWCRLKGLSEEDAAEVTQNLFKRLLKALYPDEGRPFPTYDRKESFRAWLYGAMKNVISDYVDASRRGEVQIPEGLGQVIKDDFVDDIMNREIAEIAEARVSRRTDVSESEWRAYELRHKRGKDYPEIAVILNLEVSTLYNHVSRVRKLVENELRKLCSDEE
jgi:RNA polymerase sigma factor (sigma-70 family)